MVQIIRFFPIALLCAILAGCASSPSCRDPRLGVCPSPRVVQPGQPVPKGGGRYLVGKPYVIGGRAYYPKENRHYSAVGIASWYGDAFHGRLTANGEVFDSASFSAAHPTLPIPSYVRVTNLANGRAMVVRVNDRGPYYSDRVIDVSSRVADSLRFRRNGLARVRVDYVRPARLDGEDGWLAATLTENGRPAAKSEIAAIAPKKKGKVPDQPPPTPVVVADEKESLPAPQPPVQAVATRTPSPAEGSARRLAALLAQRSDTAAGSVTERLGRLIITPPRAIGGSAPPPAAPGDAADVPRRLSALISRPMSREQSPAGKDETEKPTPVPTGPKLYLQAGTYRDKDNAERLKERLASHGTVDVSRQASNGVTWYRVRVGPISPGETSAAVRAAEQAGVVGARIAAF